MTDVINCGDKALPRSVDVQVSVSSPQTEQATALDLACLVTSTGDLPIGAGRFKVYASADDVITDFGTTSQAYYAARDFFSQPTHPKEFGIAQAFTAPQSGTLTCGQGGALESFTSIEDGSFAVTIDSVSYNVTGCDFSDATSMTDVSSVIQTAITTAGGAAGVTHDGQRFIFTSASTGDGSNVSVLTSAASGSDISGFGIINGRADAATPQAGYTPTGIDGEFKLIQEAAGCNGKFIYGWLLDETYRDSDDVLKAAAYVETLDKGIFFPCSNDPQAKNPASTTDIGKELDAFGYLRTADPFFDSNKDAYPNAALAAIMLGVNYSGTNTAITAKFKDLVGLQTEGVSVSELGILEGKGYNVFTRTGNTARVVREGTMVGPTYYIDDRVNLDNFIEELQTAVYNVFLRNGKVPYTSSGQYLIQAAASRICEKYVTNGVFAARQVATTANDSGFILEPAYTLTFASIASATASDRAQRKSPPLQIIVNLAGAIHSIAINVIANT